MLAPPAAVLSRRAVFAKPKRASRRPHSSPGAQPAHLEAPIVMPCLKKRREASAAPAAPTRAKTPPPPRSKALPSARKSTSTSKPHGSPRRLGPARAAQPKPRSPSGAPMPKASSRAPLRARTPPTPRSPPARKGWLRVGAKRSPKSPKRPKRHASNGAVHRQTNPAGRPRRCRARSRSPRPRLPTPPAASAADTAAAVGALVPARPQPAPSWRALATGIVAPASGLAASVPGVGGLVAVAGRTATATTSRTVGSEGRGERPRGPSRSAHTSPEARPLTSAGSGVGGLSVSVFEWARVLIGFGTADSIPAVVTHGMASVSRGQLGPARRCES